jgi:methylmalonyl-CoA mutase N-terminal domain/subunit
MKKPAYTPDDLAGFSEAQDLGRPGEYPFTRGIHPSMYRGRLWTMRQYAGFGSAAESNARYKFLLSQGQTALSVAFDLPTQIGLDSDHPSAAGEVGKVGVAICSLRDMEALFDGIPLESVSTSMTINATAAILLALYVAVAKKQGADLRKLSGTVQNDILKEYIARGTYIYPPRPALRLVTDLFQWCEREVPAWNTISISGYHIREAGSTAVQEVAFTLANAIAYVEAAVAAGLDVDSLAPRLSFFFNAHSDFLEEIAKFRAARRLWARIMKEQFRARNERSCMLRFHAQTAGSTLTAQQPDANIVRTAVEAFAAVLGGTQSLHTNAKDEALGLPAEDAALLALRTQQIIAHESGVVNTVDPVAGSYLIESLTTEIETRAREYLDRIAALGGMLRAIETGFAQREIQESAFATQREIESGRRVIVGVNRFTAFPDPFHGHPEERSDEGPALPSASSAFSASCPSSGGALEAAQIARLQQLRADRDQPRTDAALSLVENTARTSGNLLPPILAAVEALATVGEISDALRLVFGEHKEAVVI